MNNRDIAIQTLLVDYVLRKRKEPQDQLCKGLESLGVLSLVRENPGLMERYFVAQQNPITGNEIISNLMVDVEPVCEKSMQAFRFLKQAILKLEGVFHYVSCNTESTLINLSKCVKLLLQLIIQKAIKVGFRWCFIFPTALKEQGKLATMCCSL